MGITDGSYSLNYFSDSACNVSYSNWQLSGPLGSCVNLTAASSGLVAVFKAAQVNSCSATGYDMSGPATGDSCYADDREQRDEDWCSIGHRQCGCLLVPFLNDLSLES